MITLPIPRKIYEAAKARGWIRPITDLFPEILKTKAMHIQIGNKWFVRPDPKTEVWMMGSIAPCIVEIIS